MSVEPNICESLCIVVGHVVQGFGIFLPPNDVSSVLGENPLTPSGEVRRPMLRDQDRGQYEEPQCKIGKMKKKVVRYQDCNR